MSFLIINTVVNDNQKPDVVEKQKWHDHHHYTGLNDRQFDFFHQALKNHNRPLKEFVSNRNAVYELIYITKTTLTLFTLKTPPTQFTPQRRLYNSPTQRRRYPHNDTYQRNAGVSNP